MWDRYVLVGKLFCFFLKHDDFIKVIFLVPGQLREDTCWREVEPFIEGFLMIFFVGFFWCRVSVGKKTCWREMGKVVYSLRGSY